MMSISRCPHCRIKLGNFPYADECPGCHEELKHNITPLTSPEQKELRSNSWLVSSFFLPPGFVERQRSVTQQVAREDSRCIQ